MANRKEAPEVNAGSMADIAFLLLIFFLVTTVIEKDSGMNRLLPGIDALPPVNVKEKNLFEISLNEKGEIWVEKKLTNIEQLKALAISFLDNGGAIPGDPEFCSYCKGENNPASSDNPAKAVISLYSHRQLNYGVYITVQNELVGAYNKLRNREAQRLYGENFTHLQAELQNSAISNREKEKLRVKVKQVQQLFPMNLVEAEIKQ